MKKQQLIHCVLVVMFVFGLCSISRAEQKKNDDPAQHISLKTEVDRNKLTLGDVFNYSITIRHGSDITVNMPGWGANVGQFEIRDYKVSEHVDEEGLTVSKSEYFLAIYDTGTFTIPGIAISYKIMGDEESKQLVSDSVDIEVESVAPSEADDIKDLKMQAAVPPDYRLLYLIGSVSLLLVLIIGFLIYYFKHLRKKKEPEKEVYIGPPHEIAFKELEELLARGLVKQGQIKLFYFELSEIIRRYLGRRFQIYTLERTTDEIQQQLEQLYLDRDVYSRIIDFLENTDLVKFAKYIPGNNEIEGDVDQARTIIEKTMVFTTAVDQGEKSADSATKSDISTDNGDTHTDDNKTTIAVPSDENTTENEEDDNHSRQETSGGSRS